MMKKIIARIILGVGILVFLGLISFSLVDTFGLLSVLIGIGGIVLTTFIISVLITWAMD